MGLETTVIDALSMLLYNYSNVVGINYLWLCQAHDMFETFIVALQAVIKQ